MVKKALIDYVKKNKNDEWCTPPEAVYPLLKYLPRDKIYWECTDPGESRITQILRGRGFKVVATHLFSGFDFLKDTPSFEFDIVITNPPYSLKNAFLRKAYQLGKPFAMLLPITTLEGVERGRLFRKYGIQVLVLDRRVNFSSTEKNVWFNTSWFCWKLLPRDLIFERVEVDNQKKRKLRNQKKGIKK